MKVGVVLDGRATAQQIREYGRLAERVDLSHLWLASSLNAKDPFIRLAPLASATSRITVGAMAVSPFEMHPVRIGMSLLTLNELAEGRGALVVGAGGDLVRALGMEPQRRVRATRECVEIIKELATARVVRYRGRIFRVARFAARWTHPDRPRVYVGANRPQMLQMAAHASDGVMFSDMPPTYVRELVVQLRTALARARRRVGDLAVSNLFAWNVQPSLERARQLAAHNMPLRLYYIRDIANRIGISSEAAWRLERRQWAMVQALFGNGRFPDLPARLLDTLATHLTITSDTHHLDQCIDRLQEFARAGLTEIALALYGDPKAGIRLLGEQIVPAM